MVGCWLGRKEYFAKLTPLTAVNQMFFYASKIRVSPSTYHTSHPYAIHGSNCAVNSFSFTCSRGSWVAEDHWQNSCLPENHQVDLSVAGDGMGCFSFRSEMSVVEARHWWSRAYVHLRRQHHRHLHFRLLQLPLLLSLLAPKGNACWNCSHLHGYQNPLQKHTHLLNFHHCPSFLYAVDQWTDDDD